MLPFAEVCSHFHSLPKSFVDDFSEEYNEFCSMYVYKFSIYTSKSKKCVDLETTRIQSRSDRHLSDWWKHC